MTKVARYALGLALLASFAAGPTAWADPVASAATTSGAPAAEPPAPPEARADLPAVEIEAPAEVRLGEALAFELRAPRNGVSAAERARVASKALRDAFDTASPEDVRAEKGPDVAVIYVGSAPIVQLGPTDAAVAGDTSLDVHADAIAAKVKKAMQSEKERTALASRIFSISLVVFFGIIVFYLIRKIGEFTQRANDWLEDNPHRVPAIRVRSLMLLTPGAFRSVIAGAIAVGKWVGQLAIGYVWLLAALSLFDATRGYSERLNGMLLEPFVALTARVAGSLPITVVVLIAALVVAILFRVAGLFFESVRTGATTIEWLPPELARPTSTLVRVGLVLTTLVFAGPVLTGHPDGALARAGFVGVIAIGLASTPLLASGIVGLVVVYGRRYRVGEFVRVGPTKGKVVEIGLSDVTLADDDGNETRVPHLVTLSRPIEMLGFAPRVTARIVVHRRLATEELLRRLVDAAAAIGVEPRAAVEAVERDDATIALSVLGDEPDAKSRILLAALSTLDAREEAPPEAPPT